MKSTTSNPHKDAEADPAAGHEQPDLAADQESVAVVDNPEDADRGAIHAMKKAIQQDFQNLVQPGTAEPGDPHGVDVGPLPRGNGSRHSLNGDHTANGRARVQDMDSSAETFASTRHTGEDYHGASGLTALPIAPATDDADVTDLLDILKRQWQIILAIIVVCMLAAATVLSQLTPLYTAKAELVIEAERADLPGLEAILSVATDEQTMLTETAVLKSGVLLDSVIDRLDLISDPEFNVTLTSATDAEDAGSTGDPGSLPAAGDDLKSITRETLLASLDVTHLRDSRVIAVRATSQSGDKAARIANTLLDQYLQFRRDTRFEASSETSTLLDNRIADLQVELRKSEERAEKFRSEAQLLEAGGTSLISQQLAELNSQIIAARASTATARAELSQVTELVESADSSDILASSGVLQSPLIQELRKQQVALERETAELSSEFGPAHPRMVKLKADAADLRSQISIEVNKVVQGISNSVKVAEAREAELQRQATALTRRLSRTKEDEIELRSLEREVAVNRELLETLLASRKELGPADQMQSSQPGARVISYAAAPVKPSFPQTEISLAGILMVSTILGLVVAFIREIRRQGFSTLEQLESASKVTALGFVPFVTSRRQRRDLLDSIATYPNSPFAQAMKTLNWQLDEVSPNANRVILITSAVPNEGKTTMTIGMARVKALRGYRTLVIDADIRSPAVHTRMNLPPTPGLRDVIEGKSELMDAIVYDDKSLHVLPAGESSSDALTLVESPEMAAIINELSNQYDYIFIDSPPIATSPDACVLSKQVDATIFTVRWSQTPINAVRYALRIMKRNGGPVVGTVLNMVNVSQSANRNYGYFGYYGYYGKQGAD